MPLCLCVQTSGLKLSSSSTANCAEITLLFAPLVFVALKLSASAQLKFGESQPTLTIEVKGLRDTLTAVWDHSTMLVLIFLDPTRVQEHHCTDLVPLIASPHVVLSLGSSQLC